MWRNLKKIILCGFLFSIFYILFCKWINPPITITQINSLLSGSGLKRNYIRLNEISPNVKLAVMASEDQLFPDHNGFDFKSIEKARKHNKKSKSLRGASTISQQVAKNVFLWQHGGYFRKVLEVYFTFMIEHLWSKKRILEMYLNVAEMGEGVFGVEAASHKYFNKSSKNLSRTEAAMIAACLPNPKGYTVKPLSAHVASRYPWILQQMNHLEGDPDIQELIH
ncbi:MAG: monofunctional biosynthetic peptidoglycan transglycosylase [Bacteroidota bacterium]|nr:monofunctional biosynthetic peptidoglycan transglycosylase [Bacteroidota bacterium]